MQNFFLAKHELDLQERMGVNIDQHNMQYILVMVLALERSDQSMN